MRFVLRRAATAGTLLVAASMTAVVAATVLTALLQYAQLLPDLGTRAAVRTRPMVERSVLISGNAGDDAADVAARDDEIRRRFGGGLGGLPVAIAAGGYAIGQQLPDGFGHTVPGSRGTYADVAFLDRLPEHAGLLSGTWQRPGSGSRSATGCRSTTGEPCNRHRCSWSASSARSTPATPTGSSPPTP